MLGRAVLRVKLLCITLAPRSNPKPLNIFSAFYESDEDKTENSIGSVSPCTLLHKIQLEFRTRT